MTILVSLEGNIGSGKSTLLRKIVSTLSEQDAARIEVVQEPVDEWTAPILSNNGKSMLEEFYSDPQKNAFPFQMFALMSRYRQAIAMGEKAESTRYILSERCLQSDFNIFGRSMWDTNKFDEAQWVTYKSWFDELVRNPRVKPVSAIIYLRTSPDVCMHRIHRRMRHGESNKMTKEYVEHMHSMHERWIMNHVEGVRILVLDGDLGGDEAIEKHVHTIQRFLSSL